MTIPKIVIIGAGLSGVSTAYFLKEKGYDALVYEQDKKIGGLCSTHKTKGYSFDFAGHWLHINTEDVKNFVTNLMKSNLIHVNRKAYVYCFKCFVEAPFQYNLRNLPPSLASDCLCSFCSNYFTKKNYKIKNFESWIYKSWGKGIAEHFMIPYNKKLWLIKLSDMTCNWMGRFVPKPDIKQVIDGVFQNNSKSDLYNSYFYYPKEGGIQHLVEQISYPIKNKIILNKKVEQISLSKKQIKLNDGASLTYDILVNTTPLKDFVSNIVDIPKRFLQYNNKLRYNSVLNINIGTKNCNIDNKHWIYYPDSEVPFFRLGFYSNVNPKMAPAGKASLYTEISYIPNKNINIHAYEDKVISKLIDLQIINHKQDIEVVQYNNIKVAYVLYDKNHSLATNKLLRYLSSHDIHSVGRYGTWTYSSMEDSILQSRALALRILKGEVKC